MTDKIHPVVEAAAKAHFNAGCTPVTWEGLSPRARETECVKMKAALQAFEPLLAIMFEAGVAFNREGLSVNAEEHARTAIHQLTKDQQG